MLLENTGNTPRSGAGAVLGDPASGVPMSEASTGGCLSPGAATGRAAFLAAGKASFHLEVSASADVIFPHLSLWDPPHCPGSQGFRATRGGWDLTPSPPPGSMGRPPSRGGSPEGRGGPRGTAPGLLPTLEALHRRRGNSQYTGRGNHVRAAAPDLGRSRRSPKEWCLGHR